MFSQIIDEEAAYYAEPAAAPATIEAPAVPWYESLLQTAGQVAQSLVKPVMAIQQAKTQTEILQQAKVAQQAVATQRAAVQARYYAATGAGVPSWIYIAGIGAGAFLLYTSMKK